MDIDVALLLVLGSILLLLVVSAFLSGSETAMTAASRPRMHRLEQQGNNRARTVNQLRQQGDRLIGAILFGNNLVNILASALATSVLIGFFGEAGVVYATAAMTLLVLIFGEVLPKSYAINNAERMALAMAPVLKPVVSALSPITRLVQAVVQATLRLFRIELTTNLSDEAMEEELRGAIDLHEGAAPEIKQEREMLRSILDLGDVEVGEIMVHRRNVMTIDADAPPETILREVMDSPYTRLPLWREDPDEIVGVLHAKALLREVQKRDGTIDGLDAVAIAADPWFVPETTTLLDQLHAFRDRREHFALVIDEYGTLMGVVTLEDILEEIVGEIEDEHDPSALLVRPAGDGSFQVAGDVTIRDLNRELEWDLPDEEAATVAGLVLHEARRIPDPGQIFTFHGYRFEILRRQRNQITSLRVTPPPAPAGEQDAAP